MRISYAPTPRQQLLVCLLLAAVPQLVYLLAYGPRYEPDAHYYLTGALHWHPQHPPGYNIWLSLCYHVYPSIYLPIVLQQLVWVAAVALVARWVGGQGLWGPWLALALGAEPTLAYLHLSLQSDSLFASGLLLSAGLLVYAPQVGSRRGLWSAGLVLACAGVVRYAAVFCGPAWLLVALWRGYSWRASLLALVVPLGVSQLLVLAGHGLQGNTAYSGAEKLKWDNVASFYHPGDCGQGALCQQLDAAAVAGYFAQWPPMARYVAAEHIVLTQAELLAGQGMAMPAARQQVLDSLGHVAHTLYTAQPLAVHARLWVENAQMLAYGHFLEYRYWPPAHLPHMAVQYAELDSLMKTLYGYAYPTAQPQLWKDTNALGPYMQGMGWLLILALGLALYFWHKASLMWWLLAIMPLVLMMGLFPLKTRFLLPLMPLAWVAVVCICQPLVRRLPKSGMASGDAAP